MVSGTTYLVKVELRYDPGSSFTTSSTTSAVDGFGIWLWNSSSPPDYGSIFVTPSKFFPGCIGYWVDEAPTLFVPMNQVTTAYQTFTFTYTSTTNINRIGLAGYHPVGASNKVLELGRCFSRIVLREFNKPQLCFEQHCMPRRFV
jgi:hypothetical protein